MKHMTNAIKVHPDSGLSEKFILEMKEVLMQEKKKLERDLSGFSKKDANTQKNSTTIFPDTELNQKIMHTK